MNRIKQNWLAVAAIAAVVFMASCNSGGPNNTPASSGTNSAGMPTLSTEGLNIVYVNTDTLWEKYELRKLLKDQLDAERNRYDQQFQVLYNKFEEDVNVFKETAKYLTQAQGEERQLELMNKEKELATLEQNLSVKLAESEAKKNEEIYSTIREFMSEYAKTNGYSFVFGYSTGGTILYAENGFDVTEDFIGALNKHYNESVKK